jgi:hypothetical protein
MNSLELRRVATGLLVVVAFLGALLARIVLEGEAAMTESDRAFHRGDVRQAAVEARRAAVLYAPGARHVRAAYERLRAIAVGSEAQGDTASARFAWRVVRGSILETRHVTTPFRGLLEEANRELARLDLVDLSPALDKELARRRALQVLGEEEGPKTGWSLVLLAGLGLTGFGLLLARERPWSSKLPDRDRRVAFALGFAGVLLSSLGAYQA